MGRGPKGITIAREILHLVMFSVMVADVVLLIVQFAIGIKNSRGYIRIKDSDELPF